MIKTIFICLMQVVTFYSLAQTKISLGDKSIDKSLLKSDSYLMGYSIKKNDTYIENGNYETKITTDNKRIDVKTTLLLHNSDIQWEDHLIANANRFSPISSNSARSGVRNFTLSFSNTITGELKNKNRKYRK